MNIQDTYLNAQLNGFYKVGVVDPCTDEVKWQTEEPQKNLILNQGMDNLAVASVVDQFVYAYSGVGSRPNSISGLTSTITQSGTVVYMNLRTGLIDFTSSNATYAASAQVGDMLVYQNNSQSQITSVVDGFNLLVTPSYAFNTGQTFTIWKTSQTGLQSKISSSNTYYVGAADGTWAGSATVGNVITHTRTYDFPVEGGLITYNEVGVGPDSSNAFSRIPITPLTITAGLKLRLMYQLQTVWTPTSSFYKTASIGNWPVAPATDTIGSESLQVLKTSTINTVDGTSVINQIGTLDPYFISNGDTLLTMWGSSASSSLAAFGSFNSRASGSSTTTNFSRASYTAGSYFVDKTGVFPITALVSNTIWTIGLGNTTTGQSYAFRFNQSQTKSSAQTLSITFRHAWSRVLA